MLLFYLMFGLLSGVELVKVKITEGWLRGELLEASTGDKKYYSFKGIPYAAPPLGNLRFVAPQPPFSWKNVREATRHGPKCIQTETLSTKLVPGSEDCLFINVYSPDLKPKEQLPVMFFIYGGGYKSGSGDVDDYGPDFLIRYDVVVVTFNYRLGALGFLCTETKEVPGNAGMKDQVAALRWVKSNIAHFGGNPDQVTIFGQSAGGASVALHTLSPLSKGLFKRAIVMSDSFYNDPLRPFESKMRALVLGKRLGLDTANTTELLDYLRCVPAEKLFIQHPNVIITESIAESVIKLFYFTPVVEKDFGDDHFLTEDPEVLLSQGKIQQDVDLIVGHTNIEGIYNVAQLQDRVLKYYPLYQELLVPRKISNIRAPTKVLELSRLIYRYYFGDRPINLDTIKEFVYYYTDANYAYDVYRFINKFPQSAHKNRFYYIFSPYTERNYYSRLGAERYGLYGSAHRDDLMYLFDGKRFNLTLVKNSTSFKIINNFCALLTNFAKFGNPTPDNSENVIWPKFDKEQRYLNIGKELTARRIMFQQSSLSFWKNILERAKLEF
ncbi:carboxyl/cholinesterase 1 precursor [Bombyx mori]|uniref:Carboxylic ester hydrolase n=1 Tax=Bombyx mori TaxID=7091 RepID=D2KTU3_BOMMO|nr:carboxyl/cholinesterase 1 precursor [Bombyx mori]BAI66477.1 carboxyl/cholinesterase 1 [Bombyx mori]